MADLYEVLLVDGAQRWHAGFVVGEGSDGADLLLQNGRSVLVFGSRAGLEHTAQQRGLDLLDDVPDEIDLDLGGWLPRGSQPPRSRSISSGTSSSRSSPRCCAVCSRPARLPNTSTDRPFCSSRSAPSEPSPTTKPACQR